MQPFTDFSKRFYNQDVVRTLEAMQKRINFYHNKSIDMLKLGFTLPNLASFSWHKSTDLTFYPSAKTNKELPEKIREDMVVGPSVAFTRQTVVGKTLKHKPTNLCNFIVSFDASQLYPFSMCQPMLTDTTCEYDSGNERFTGRQNKSRFSGKKTDCFSIDKVSNTKHCFRSYRILLSLLSLSWSLPVFNWYRNWEEG